MGGHDYRGIMHAKPMGLFGWGKKKPSLTKKQRAQRKYAAGIKAVRARAAKKKGGQGRIAKRSAATRLRRKYGLKSR